MSKFSLTNRTSLVKKIAYTLLLQIYIIYNVNGVGTYLLLSRSLGAHRSSAVQVSIACPTSSNRGCLSPRNVMYIQNKYVSTSKQWRACINSFVLVLLGPLHIYMYLLFVKHVYVCMYTPTLPVHLDKLILPTSPSIKK